MKLERPTYIAAIAYAVMACVILSPLNIGEYDTKMQQTGRYNLGYRLMLVLVLAIPVFLSLYSINCMVRGRCVLWSYANSAAVCLWVILFLVASIIASQKAYKQQAPL